jgi:hypothetical protein
MPDNKYSVVRKWQDGDSDSILYQLARDRVEIACTVRISKTQKATHGEAALIAWCRRHADQLCEKKIVNADLNEERGQVSYFAGCTCHK